MNIHYAQMLAHELYNIDIPTDTFEELALIAMGFIGNKRCRLYRYIADALPSLNGPYIELPCNVNEIEAVTGEFEDWQFVTNRDSFGDVDSALVELYIEINKRFLDPLYNHGKYLHFEKVGNKLYFDRPYHHICVLYKGQVLDEDGLPDINDKEANAIAAYIAYTQKFKEGIISMNKNVVEVANMLKLDWNIKCDLARTPESINLNEMDEILDAKTSWNRKQFHKSLKPIK